MRRRRFPLISVLVVLLLSGVVGYQVYLNADLPQIALGHVGDAAGQLWQGLKLMAGGGGGVEDYQEQQTAPPENVLPVLVSAQNPIPEGYVPSGLVRMREYSDESVVHIKDEEMLGNREAVQALMLMLRTAVQEGLGDWQISAGYRTMEQQQAVWDEQVSRYEQEGLTREQAQSATAKYVAQPGYSEHHTGLAFDVTVPGQSFPLTEQSRWLAERCWDFGFIIRYTEEKAAITGINAEPWHVRYVGQPHATRMKENNWCLEEYIQAMGGG